MTDPQEGALSLAPAYLAEQAALVSEELQRLFSDPHQPKSLFDSMHYSLMAGGKRLRPVLCLAVGRSFGVSEADLLPVAVALEILHTYSLIHDDLPTMDDDDLRRGQPTNHRVFGEATALLAGDALLTYAFEQLAKPAAIPAQRQLRMVQVLASAAGCFGMVAGQVADLEAEGTPGSMDALRFIHLHKTARLIEASVQLGAIFAGVEAAVEEALCRFGRSLGLAFQIADDLLDVIGDTAALGKTVGSDERMSKLTYPKLVGVDETKRLMQVAHADALTALDSVQIDAPLLRSLANFVIDRGV